MLYCCRIYVKKVRKFLDCAVDITVDKKQLKLEMDRAFQSIKDCYADRLGHDRSVDASLYNIFIYMMYNVYMYECVPLAG